MRGDAGVGRNSSSELFLRVVLRRWRPPVVLEGSDHKERSGGEHQTMGKLRGTVRGRGGDGAHRNLLERRRSTADGEKKWRRPGGV